VNLVVPGSAPQQVLVRGDWSAAVVPLPEADPLLPRTRINLAVDPDSGGPTVRHYPAVYVGQPKIVSIRERR